MVEIKINVISKNDIEAYRSIRLASLQDSPDSFGSTYERELSLSKNEWLSRISPEENTIHLLPLIVEYNNVYVGLAFGAVHKQEPNSAHIYQMWVSPNHRGNGIGKALLNYIQSWAKELRLNNLLLAVTTTNLNAVNLYKSVGFFNVGELEPLRTGSSLAIQPMELTLNLTHA